MKNDKIIKIIRVAKKNYESLMDLKVIALKEGMSVSTVSRMLKKAEEKLLWNILCYLTRNYLLL